MAFDPKKFAMIGATLNGTTQSWNYETADALATTVVAAAYAVGAKALGAKLFDKVYIQQVTFDGAGDKATLVAHGYRVISAFNAAGDATFGTALT